MYWLEVAVAAAADVAVTITVETSAWVTGRSRRVRRAVGKSCIFGISKSREQ